jgi:hypothetical protein
VEARMALWRAEGSEWVVTRVGSRVVGQVVEVSGGAS